MDRTMNGKHKQELVKNGAHNGVEEYCAVQGNGVKNGNCENCSIQCNGDTNGTNENGVSPLKKKMAREQGTYKISPDSNFHFLEDLFEMMVKDGLVGAMDRNKKVCEFKQPEELKTIMSDLAIEERSASSDRLLDTCKKIIKYSVKSAHPRFFNQLFGGMDQYSLGGAWLTDTLNTSQYTYEVAPVFTLMEKEVYQKMLGLVGFDGGEAIFTPGGSMANFYAMNVARYSKYPDIKTKGMMCLDKPLRLFTSEKAHYSIKKGAASLGLGTDSVIQVKTDRNGKMIPEALEEAIQEAIAEGYEPFFVNATAGTTVHGAYDPLEAIADISKTYGLWMHVDGAWGASAILSRTHRHLMKGINMADSLSWNPHKMMGVPLQCSTFLTRHKGLLNECHSAHARYLFQQDKQYDVSYDTGDMSLQCGRRVDVVKLWMMWKGKGDIVLERDIDHVFSLSRYLAKILKETEGFRLLQEPECTNVCFWYIPPSLRGLEETDDWWQKLGKVAPAIKTGMMQCGSMMMGYQPEGGTVNFFRMIISNFDTTTEDVDFIVEEIDRLGRNL